jgi:hypothetical protein
MELELRLFTASVIAMFLSLRLHSWWALARPKRLPVITRDIPQRSITKSSTREALPVATDRQVFRPPPVAWHSDEREEHYWKKIPRWEDVAVDKFLSHQWQVHSSMLGVFLQSI